MGRVSRRQLAVVGAGVALLAIAVVALLFKNSVPRDAASTLVSRAVLTGPVEPDPTDQPVASDGSDPEPQSNALSPSGQACLSRMTSGSGWLDLCWEAYRLGGDADPQKDYYLLRLYGSHQGLRWVAVKSQLIGTPADRVYDVWPDGTYEGACRQEPVPLMVPVSNLNADDICGHTEAHADTDHWSHDLAWSCEGCIIPGSDARGLSMYTVVAMPEGTVPSWDVFANVGS